MPTQQKSRPAGDRSGSELQCDDTTANTYTHQNPQYKYQPLRLTNARAYFENRIRNLSGIDAVDGFNFEGHLTAATWVPKCDAKLEASLIEQLEAVRACAKAALVLHQKHEALRLEIIAFHERTWFIHRDAQDGFGIDP